MDPIHKLTEYFREFPGIGPRQAKRFVYFLMTKNSAYLDSLAKLILEIRKNVRVCSLCFRFYQDGNSKVCPTCSNRDEEKLMIVSRDVDFESIEKSKSYNGYYFILGGSIPILDKEPEKRVRLRELVERIKKGKFKEIILSLNSTADGEHTADFIKNYIKEKMGADLTVSVLGRGLSTGAELEYSDSDTIKNALKNREKV
ncbi:MAG TPA: toprim domain-containing protein [Candidatus Paceibacterota bacterium]